MIPTKFLSRQWQRMLTEYSLNNTFLQMKFLKKL